MYSLHQLYFSYVKNWSIFCTKKETCIVSSAAELTTVFSRQNEMCQTLKNLSMPLFFFVFCLLHLILNHCYLWPSKISILLVYSRVASPQWARVNEKERTLRRKTQKKNLKCSAKQNQDETSSDIAWNSVMPNRHWSDHFVRYSELYYIYRKNVQNILCKSHEKIKQLLSNGVSSLLR